MDSKPSRVPEPDSRPMQAISLSAPPSSDQLVISPVKILAICSTVRSATALSLLTMTAMPSSATTVSMRPWLFSSSFRAREERPMSAVPFMAASMPAPEPPPSTETVTPLWSLPNCSASVFMTFSIEVEPSVTTVPDRPAEPPLSEGAELPPLSEGAALLPLSLLPQAARDRAITSAIISAMSFFILILSISSCITFLLCPVLQGTS